MSFYFYKLELIRPRFVGADSLGNTKDASKSKRLFVAAYVPIKKFMLMIPEQQSVCSDPQFWG